MSNLANFLPWYFWVVLGGIGVPMILKWVFTSAKNDPIIWRSSWMLFSVICVLTVTDNLIRGTGIYIEHLQLVDNISIPLIILAAVLMYTGGYQKIMRPGFDLAKRKIFLRCLYGTLATLLGMGLLFAICTFM